MDRAAYDRFGIGYERRRRSDPRIATRIEAALGDAQTVLNVGAGTGSYEPTTCEIVAVEPSAEMIAQRPADAAPVVQASAEELPFDDHSFDAVMAIFSDHHWADRPRGLRELLRVARRRVVLLNADPALAETFWLSADYLPGFLALVPEPYRQAGHWEEELRDLLGELEVSPVAVPHDCQDGFYQAYWRRPAAYLDQDTRRATSVFHRLDRAEVATAMERLGRDLDDGTWASRYRRLSDRDELDVGLRLVIASVDS